MAALPSAKPPPAPASAAPPAPAASAPIKLASTAPVPLPVAKPVSLRSEVFAEPVYNGKRLDWCRGWKDACGRATADEWCKSKGYLQAANFTPDPHIGATKPTRQLASGLVCDEDRCDGFKAITCSD
jgi:hypothetical protein